ncbi:MAG: hypothetical protein HC853_06950 [Anaerolineae bacterium]|nr:hypothetical protein [Anaerolineae bacterium]
MFQATRTPWLSISQLAQCAKIEIVEARTACEALVEAGLFQAAILKQSGYPPVRYAPTVQGLIELPNELATSQTALMRRLKLTPARYWALRACMPISQDLATLCCASEHSLVATNKVVGSHASQFDRCEWELFIPRQHKTSVLFLQGCIHFYAGDRVYPYFLLVDRGESSVWQWYRHLRYLHTWAKRVQPASFPPLLVISTRVFRALAMLVLSRMGGNAISVAVTGDRSAVLKHGLFSSQPPICWKSFDAEGVVVDVDPFAMAGMDRKEFERSPFVIASLQTLTRREGTKACKVAMPDLDCPLALVGLDVFEQMGNTMHKILAFLSRNPVSPISCIASFNELPSEQVQIELDCLAQAGLAERVQTKLTESIWSATDQAVRLIYAREMQTPGAIKRYHFYRADHERRLIHTLSTYRFFENLKKQCEGHSRATRKLDTLPGTLNEGRIPYYELVVFESELIASDWYVLNGATRYWRPDGYGALRAGAHWTRFWVEIDGTANSPSRKDPTIWDGKMGRLCDYLVSRRWVLRYPEPPRLLVITTDLKNRTYIHDALVEAARARSMTPPNVYIASAAAVQQRGAIAQIWQSATDDSDERVYAFDAIAPLATKSAKAPPVNLVTEMARAGDLGLIEIASKQPTQTKIRKAL